MPKTILAMPAAGAQSTDDILYLIQSVGSNRDRKITLGGLFGGLVVPIVTNLPSTSTADPLNIKKNGVSFLKVGNNNLIAGTRLDLGYERPLPGTNNTHLYLRGGSAFHIQLDAHDTDSVSSFRQISGTGQGSGLSIWTGTRNGQGLAFYMNDTDATFRRNLSIGESVPTGARALSIYGNARAYADFIADALLQIKGTVAMRGGFQTEFLNKTLENEPYWQYELSPDSSFFVFTGHIGNQGGEVVMPQGVQVGKLVTLICRSDNQNLARYIVVNGNSGGTNECNALFQTAGYDANGNQPGYYHTMTLQYGGNSLGWKLVSGLWEPILVM